MASYRKYGVLVECLLGNFFLLAVRVVAATYDENYTVTTPVLCDCRVGCQEPKNENLTVADEFQNYYYQELNCLSNKGSLPYVMIDKSGKGMYGSMCSNSALTDVYGQVPTYYVPYEAHFSNNYCFFVKRYDRYILIPQLIHWRIQITFECFYEKLNRVQNRHFGHLLKLVLADREKCQLMFLPPREYISTLKICITITEKKCAGNITDVCNDFFQLPKKSQLMMENYKIMCLTCSWIANDTENCLTKEDSFVVLHEPRKYTFGGLPASEKRCLLKVCEYFLHYKARICIYMRLY